MGAAAAIIFSGKCPFRKIRICPTREEKCPRRRGSCGFVRVCVCVFVRDCDTVQGCNLFPVRSCDPSGTSEQADWNRFLVTFCPKESVQIPRRIACVEISAPKKIAYFSTRLTREHESVFVTSLPSVSVFVTHTETSGGDRRACC